MSLPPENLIINVHIFSFAETEDSNRRKRWRDCTEGDIKMLVAYNLLIGIIKKPSIASYWSKITLLHTPFFHEYMSRNTFQLLSSNLHFNNDLHNPPRSDPNHDPLAKLRPIVNTLQHQFRSCYTPRRDLGLDEMGCKFHGVCKFRQYNPNKPDKYHLKIYGVAEAESGFLVGFEVYVGKGPPTTRQMMSRRWGAPESSTCAFGNVPQGLNRQGKPWGSLTLDVMQLLHKFKLLDLGHHIYTDNLYTSAELADGLLTRSTMLCGTMRPKTVWPRALKIPVSKPSEAKNPKKIDPHRKHMFLRSGAVCWRRSHDGDLLAFVYADRKLVSVLSTIHKASMTILCVRNEFVLRPLAVHDYNRKMSAVDHCDQILRYYELQRKSFTWTRKLFFHLVNMSMVNAYLAYKIDALAQGENRATCR